jgi:hypothetical protein
MLAPPRIPRLDPLPQDREVLSVTKIVRGIGRGLKRVLGRQKKPQPARMGPVTFVERQIAHLWAGSMICIALLFPLEAWLNLPPLKLSPVLGLVTGTVFLAKAGILSGEFYIWAVMLFLTAIPMALFPRYAHFIFGVVSA